MIIRLLSASLVVSALAPWSAAFAQQATPTPPPYYFDREYEPPSDFSPQDGHFEAKAMNAQAYVVFDYVADSTDPEARRTPLVSTAPGEPYIALTWPGDLGATPSQRPSIRNISDVAEDGSFWVVGQYFYDGNAVRGVAWKVSPDGSSTLHRLENLYFAGEPTNEERDGYPHAVNSSGVAVGYSQDEPPLRTQIHSVGARWNLPATAATRLSTDEIFMNPAVDVDEEGNFVAPGFYRDGSYFGAFYNYQPLPTVSRRSITPHSLAANRIVGSYEFDDEAGIDGPFIYTAGSGALVRLPRPAAADGDFYKDPTYSTGDAGKFINEAGDVAGVASNPPSQGNEFNRSHQVLWKRQPDGSYTVHTLRSILEANNKIVFQYDNAEFHGISADSSILMSNFLDGRRRARLLRAGERPTDQPLNISTRLRVQSGDNVLIGGMIVTGPESKTVLIRAIGPSLSEAGVVGALQDPRLELYRNGALSIANNDWRDLEAFFEPGNRAHGFQPPHEREAAIVTSLSANETYTAVVLGQDGGEGVGLVEVYDLSRETDAQLANISTRGFVEAGDDVMIAGFILGGKGAKLLLRALGPSLGDAGVAGALQDPTLQVVDGNGEPIAFNDNWGGGEPDKIPEGFAPLREEESAIVVTLPSGAYTAVVRGNGSTGVGLVEVYNLP